jgi:glycosyltransferase involved in cell wall biosynthesis
MKRKTRLDALFFHTQVAATLSIDLMRKIPSVVSLDATPLQYDDLGEYYQHSNGPEWIERLKYRLNLNCFQTAQHLVTWSQWAKDSLVDDYHIDADKITVIPPGVNISDWARPDDRNGDKSTVRILFVGGDLKRKGGYDLLEAFRQLRNEEQVGREGKANIQLHLVTKEHLPDEPGLYVYNHMGPNSTSLKQLYHDCHIFCLPTYGDCLPMVLSEAGAAGLPIISTQVSAIPEIVYNNETGYIVPAGDVTTLSDALRRLINDPGLRNRFGEDAHHLVVRSHDAKRNAERLLDLLKETAGGANP